MRAGFACGADTVVAFADGWARIAGSDAGGKDKREEDGDGLHVPIIRLAGPKPRYQPDLSAEESSYLPVIQAAVRRAWITASRSGCST